jgi:general secretion pathway protein I
MRSTRPGLSRGFSLLEMVVAMAILSLSLGALYQATSGATRNVRADEKYAYGVELARSVLASYASIPRQGVDAHGETSGGFTWSVMSSPLPVNSQKLPAGSLHNIEVSVVWQDGRKQGAVVLDSVVSGMPQE